MASKNASDSLRQPQDNQALISLAILKVNWDVEKKDYLENFVPIVAESVKLLSSDVISLIDLQEAIKTHFGLELSQNSLAVLLQRTKKRGYIKQENNVFYRNTDALNSTNFRTVQQQVLLMHEALITQIREFADETLKVKWSAEDAENALYTYLTESGHNILAAVTRKTAIPKQHHATKSEKFIVASFVQHAQEKHTAAFEYLETIVKGSILATALFLKDPSAPDRRFRKTQVFFDTSFIVFALGYAGLPRRDPCVELLQLLYETGADLRCFEHTLGEVRGVLLACAHRIASGTLRDAYGPSIEYFLSEGYTASDIEYFSNRLEIDLKLLRISVVEKPPYIEKFLIDEKGLTKALSDQVGYRNQDALDKDVTSISAIMRLRGTALQFFIEESRAIFVTKNNALARVATEFTMVNTTPGAIPPCTTDYHLTNLLWLKKPFHAPDLPKKRLIADCYAATQPDDHLWQKYLDEIDKLSSRGVITANDVYLLRHSLQARSALMEKTLGDEYAFVQGTVPEILQLVRSNIESKVRSDYDEEVNRRKQIEAQLIAEHLKQEEVERRLMRRAQSYAAMTVQGLKWILLVFLTFSTAYSFPWSLPPISSNWFRYSLSGFQALFLVLGAIHLFRGTTINTYLRQIESGLSTRIEHLLKRIAGI
jgi:hypothetical protein